MSILKQTLGIFRQRRRLRQAVGRCAFDSVKCLKVVAFPNRLHEGYALGKCLRLLGIQAEQFDSWSRADLVIHWQDQTLNTIDAFSYISLSGSQWHEGRVPHGLNYLCKDISKAEVGRAHFSAFGYALDVDPATYSGLMVEKSDANATHDGRVVRGPLAAKDIQSGKVYSVLVNNTHEGCAVDCRLVFLGGSVLPFYYEKMRPLEERFANTNTSVRLRNTADSFTPEELDSIRRVSSSLKADYGELDVLRDNQTGRVYVVDFAKTPVGPPNGLSDQDAGKAVFDMSQALVTNVLLPLVNSRC